MQNHVLCEQILNLSVRLYKIQCVIDYLIQTGIIPCFCCMPLLSFGLQGQSRSKMKILFLLILTSIQIWMTYFFQLEPKKSYFDFFNFPSSAPQKKESHTGYNWPDILTEFTFLVFKAYTCWTMPIYNHTPISQKLVWFNLTKVYSSKNFLIENNYSFKFLKVHVNALVEISFEILDWDAYWGHFLRRPSEKQKTWVYSPFNLIALLEIWYIIEIWSVG